MAYNFTRNDERLIEGVFCELLKMDYHKLNTILGSLTIQEVQSLYSRLHYNDYCERYGIKYEEMTDEDYIRAYEEEEEVRYQLAKEAREAEEAMLAEEGW